MAGTTIAQLLGTSQSGKTTIASKLGKKGTISDVALYNQPKKSLTVIDPIKYPSSIVPILEFLSITDVPVLTLPPRPIDRYTAEMAIVLELLKCKEVIILKTMKNTISPPEFQQYWISTRKKLSTFKHLMTSSILEIDINNGDDISRLREQILRNGTSAEIKATNNNDTIVLVDHSFPVKGVGTVVLGRVISGHVEKGMRLNVHPMGTNVIVRSIQIHDKDTRTAPIASRVGIAIKGSFSTLKRGMVLTSHNSEITSNEEARLSDFSKAPFSRSVSKLKQVMCVHGLQRFPVAMAIEDSEILLKAQKPFVWLPGLPIFLVDPNHSQRLLGIGKI